MTGLLFAQEAAPAGVSAPAAGLIQFLPLVIIFLIFYFLLIMPQQKKQKKHQEMLDTLKPGDQVVTQGGLYGKVTDIKVETLTLEIAPNTKVKVSRGSVSAKVE